MEKKQLDAHSIDECDKEKEIQIGCKIGPLELEFPVIWVNLFRVKPSACTSTNVKVCSCSARLDNKKPVKFIRVKQHREKKQSKTRKTW